MTLLSGSDLERAYQLLMLRGAGGRTYRGGLAVAELSECVGELEGFVREQAWRFSLELTNRDALIAELRADCDGFARRSAH